MEKSHSVNEWLIFCPNVSIICSIMVIAGAENA